MDADARAPAGPRGVLGAAAEEAAAAYLERLGWSVLARNLRVGTDELDILAIEPGPRASLVVVEVRSRSGPGFGAAIESVDARKVQRLYRAAMRLRHSGHPAIDVHLTARLDLRIDLLALRRTDRSHWRVEHHLRGVLPP